MSEEAEAEEKEKGDLSKYYEFTYSDEEREKVKNLPYFQKVMHDKDCVEGVISKIQKIREELREKSNQLRRELSEQAREAEAGKKSPEDEQDRDLLKQDLKFCDLAYFEGGLVRRKAQNDKEKLNEILEKGEKRSYRVIVDVALVPLPSDRAKQKNKDKDNDKDKGKNKGGEGKDNAGVGKLSSSDLDKLRKGQPLNEQNLSNTDEKTTGKQAGATENKGASKPTTVQDGINNLRQGRMFNENETHAPVQKTTLDKSRISDYVRQ